MGTETRKDEHLDLFKAFDFSGTGKSGGFERLDWIPAETADIAWDSVNPETSFLGYPLSFPFMIAAISGGSVRGNALNETLAEMAEAEKIPLGTGSIRSSLENPDHVRSLVGLREKAPHIPLIANIGIAQIRDAATRKKVEVLVKEGRFDALAVHFNKIQELIQPEGDKTFTGIREALATLVETLEVPVIAKQVGHGFSGTDIQMLWETGIRFTDLAGAGGSSWSKAERTRNGETSDSDPFDSWGIPTTECLITALKVTPGMYCIAGGGINTGHDMAKALALGARLTSSANAIYQAVLHHGKEGLRAFIRESRLTLKRIMFLTGCPDMNHFRGNPDILRFIHE